MSRIDHLLENYRSHIQMPLRSGLPPSQRVWFAVYPAEEERRVVNRIEEFELITKEAGRGWVQVDLKACFSKWLSTVDEEERADWFRNPSDIELFASKEWGPLMVEFFKEQTAQVPNPEGTVFALTGLMELYDYLPVSSLIERLEKSFKGFLLVFFPGEKEGNTYRFLNARTGWNYLAVPITSDK